MSTDSRSPNQVLTVRRAGASDVGSLVALMHDFYAEAGFALDHERAAAAFVELLTQPSLGCCWLAFIGAEPIGHAVLTFRYTMEHGGLSGYVDDLFVRAASRRVGAGRAMLDELFAECRARGCPSVQVEVGHDNAAALGLYAQFGLVPHDDGRILLAGPVGDAQSKA